MAWNDLGGTWFTIPSQVSPVHVAILFWIITLITLIHCLQKDTGFIRAMVILSFEVIISIFFTLQALKGV